MLKIRYAIKSGLLSGWTDVDPDSLQPRRDEDTTELDIIKPEPSADYEYWQYDGSNLVRSDKPVPKPHTQPDRIVFTATPPGEALGERLKNIEDFLKGLYPE